MIKKKFLLIFALVAISCNKKTERPEIQIKNEKNVIDFFQPADLGAFGSATRLLVYANFDECGEWGGHKESFEIFSKGDKQFYANYKRTKVDCDKLGKLYGKPEFQQPYVDKVIKLEDKQKEAINNYLSQLIKSKIKEGFPGNAGQNFGVIKTDSTLVIDVYDSDKKNLENYNQLLKSFNLEIVKYEYR
ncbi:hypothetical protein ACQKCJ_11535 [Flavobacterium sp. NPDC079362]|uniref:hypothetical protein n=1 Tax=Flavobacterium sp. NPDC079362 TaxID=3390566 RepID=UPI003D05E392